MKKTLSVIALALIIPFVAGASEVTGTLTTGVSTGVEGTVVAAPIATPGAGTYTSTQNVALTATGSQSIRYTTNGDTPTCSSGTLYTGTISVATSLTIRALSCYPNDEASDVAVFAYGINLPAAPGGCPIEGGGGGGIIFISPANGNTNGDSRVDIIDFNTLLVQWGLTGPGHTADFNSDGVVDILDFNILLINWTA